MAEQKKRNYIRYFMMKAHYENRKCDSHIVRMGKVQRAVMENFPILIHPDHLLHGWGAQTEEFLPEHHRRRYDVLGVLNARAELTEEQQAEYDALEAWMNDCPATSGFGVAATGHRVLDYEKLLTLGAKGVLAEVEGRLEEIDYSQPGDCERENLYLACREALTGLIHYGERVSAAYKEAAEAVEDACVKARLARLSTIFANVPANPACGFYEAMQSMWTLEFIENSLGDITLTGRPTDYLYPYYKADKEKGLIDDEFVQALINDLYYRHNDIYGAWPAAIMVGGVNRKGEPVWNELTYMFIRAIEETGLVNPSVNVCYNKDMPEDLMQLCMEIIAKGYTRPAFFNDDLIIESLLQAGVPVEDARYYIHSTCVEITPIAASNIQVATPYININKAVEMVLTGGGKIWGDEPEVLSPMQVDTASLDTFEKFLSEIKRAMSMLIRRAVRNDCHGAEQQRRYACAPLSSCFINDCLSLGKDSGTGGARYNYYYPCFPGFINLIDSVAAVKKAVYEEGRFTLESMRELLADNFEDNEKMRQYLLNCCPKFGNDLEETDALGQELYDHIRAELEKYHTALPNGKFYPSYFAWIMHGRLGRVAAASPDGRKQGTAVSESLGAAQGRDKNGPLAVVRSISKIDQTWGIGGIATNFRFSKSMMKTEEGRQAVIELVHTFMAERNFECQFNVVDQAVLLDAKKNPENHRNLLVRVAGYSDYFVNLDPVIQDEIITRTEHETV